MSATKVDSPGASTFPAQPHLVHTSEQLPVESSQMIGHIFRLHPVDLCVSRGDLDLLRKGYLVAGRVRGTWLPVVVR